MTPTAVKALLDRLFTSSTGEIATWLVLTGRDGRNLDTLSREAVRNEIYRAIGNSWREGLRDAQNRERP